MKQLLAVFYILVSGFASGLYAQSGVWTWMNGSNQSNQPAVYGTQGVPAPGNHPQGLYEAACWVDLQGNFWIYGGIDPSNLFMCDLWKYDPVINQWAWMKGNRGVSDFWGSYGQQGVPGPTDNPPGLGFGIASWTDHNGDLWLFGGAQENFEFNQLWRYHISTNEWTRMTGADNPGQPDIYDTLGVLSTVAMPGGRSECLANWVDTGNLWLFGGFNIANNGCYSDMWRYNIATNQWAWMKGPAGTGRAGVYGSFAIEAPGNVPPARCAYTRSQDNAGNFYLFAGIEWTHEYRYNDVWKYNSSTNNWSWIGGSNTAHDTVGRTGPYCSNIGNTGPRARYENRTPQFNGCTQAFLSYGGAIDYDDGTSADLSDLWMFDLANRQWLWLSGSDSVNAVGNCGILGVPSPDNLPPARSGGCTWMDSQGNFWMFGGVSGENPVVDHYNDMWRYVPDQNCVGSLLISAIVTASPVKDSVCAGDTVVISVNPAANAHITPAGNVVWKDPSHAYLIPDSTTTFTLIGQTHCGTDTQTIILYVFPMVKAGFSITPSAVNITEPVVNLINQATGYSNIFWHSDTGSLNFAGNNTLQFADTGIYCIRQVATNAWGCADSVTHCIEVGPSPVPAISVPEAFTPNGDGVNDFFTVFGKNLHTYHILIFNRWGEKVYESSEPGDLNNPGRGWDGTYKGKLQDPGSFAWVINATDNAGNKIEKKGMLILIR